MKKVKFENLLVGAVLPGLLALFILMALEFSIPESMFAVILIAACGAATVYFWQQNSLLPAARRIVTVILCIAAVGSVVVLARTLTLTVTNANTFSHNRYLAVTAKIDSSAANYMFDSSFKQTSKQESDNGNYPNTSPSTVDINGNSISVTAQGFSQKDSGCDRGTYYDVFKDKVTVTITNVTTAPVRFTISYSGSAQGTSGEITLQPKGTHTFTVDGAYPTAGSAPVPTYGSAVITGVQDVVSNPPKDITTTFLHDSGGTFKVGDTVITESVSMVGIGTDSYVLTATPDTANGYSFYGWFSSLEGLFSTATTYTLELMEGMEATVWPLFVKDHALYYVQDASPRVYYKFFDDAFDAAGPDGTVVVYQSGTLYGSKGQTELTITKNQKLLIPFSDTDRGFFGPYPTSSDSNGAYSDVTPTTFRSLTVPSGTKLICNGSINVNGQRVTDKQGDQGTGAAKGNHGLLVLEGEGDQLIIGSTGKLYAYGFVTGTGTVALNGGTLHELIQVFDWNGGSMANRWKSKAGYNSLGELEDTAAAQKTMFLLGHYYIQNVEAPLRVQSGSNVNVESVVTVLSIFQIVTPSNFIGPSGLFQLGENTYITRTYDKSNDRVTYAVKTDGESGSIKFGSIVLEAEAMGTGVSIKSDAHILPINNALTIEIGNNVTVDMSNRLAMMPGSEVIVHKGATVNLANQLYIFDKEDKTTNMFYAPRTSPAYTAGRGDVAAMPENLPSARLEVNGTLNISGGGAIYTTTNHANGDKIILGTGTIINNGEIDNGFLQAGYDTENVSFSELSMGNGLANGLANLAGVGLMQPMTNTTEENPYRGVIINGVNYWYIYSEVTATCNAAGSALYWCTDKETAVSVDVPALGHDWEDVSYEWNEDNTVCTATRVCKRDEAHTETATLVSVTSENTATCTEAGKIIYTATFQEDWAGSNTEEVDSEPLTHDWDQIAYTWNGDYTVSTATRVCKRDNTHTESAAATGAQITAETITAGTCETDGLVKYTATFTEAWAGSDAEDVTVTAPGHSWNWAEGVCSACGEKAIRYDSIQLSIDAEILLKLKFYIHEDLVNAEGATFTVAEEGNKIIGADGRSTTKPLTEMAVENSQRSGIRYVASEGIAAGEMTGNVTVSFMVAGVTVPVFNNDNLDAAPVSELIRAVVDFAEAAYAAEGAEGKNVNLAKGALTFGGYAQLFYGTDKAPDGSDKLLAYDAPNYDPLSLEGVDALLADVPQSAFSGSIGVKASTQKLNLDSSIYIRTYFTLPAEKTVNDYQVKITRPTENGTVLVTEGGSWGVENGRIYIDILNVPPAYWDNTYTITISDAENNTYVVNTSVLAWCARCVKASGAVDTQKDMARAMYLYCQAANTYFKQTFGEDPT